MTNLPKCEACGCDQISRRTVGATAQVFCEQCGVMAAHSNMEAAVALWINVQTIHRRNHGQR